MPPHSAVSAKELLRQIIAKDDRALKGSVQKVDNLSDDDVDDEKHKKNLERQSREDEYGVIKAITTGIRTAVKVLSFCFAVGILLGFLLVCILAAVYVFHVIESPDETKALLGKCLEWAGVLFTGLFFENLWRGRKRD